jgi:hypothetical protein
LDTRTPKTLDIYYMARLCCHAMKAPKRVLLVIPAALALATPLYARGNPALVGVPFFVWFQFLLVLIGMAVTLAVFGLERHPREAPVGQGDPTTPPGVDGHDSTKQ